MAPGQLSEPGALPRPARSLRRDAVRNYERILTAARQVLDETGPDACMEEIAARAGVGVGTVYRRFASKDALIDELLGLAMDELLTAAEHALTRTDGSGLEYLLRALGRSFADHARYANLLLERQPDPAATAALRTSASELTARAVAAGTIDAGITIDDVMTLIAAMRGLVRPARDATTDDWQRFLDIHLTGLRSRR